MINHEYLARKSLRRFSKHHMVDDLIISSQPFGSLTNQGAKPFATVFPQPSPVWQDTAYGLVGCVKGLKWALEEIDKLRTQIDKRDYKDGYNP